MNIKIKLKEFLPKKILPRLLMIFFIPLVFTQILAIYFFYQKHWEKITTRFSNIAVNQISLIIKDYKKNGFSSAKILSNQLNVRLLLNKESKFKEELLSNNVPEKILKTINSRLKYDYLINILDDTIHIEIPIDSQNLEFIYPKKYLISETPTIFFLWIILTSFFLSFIAFLFLRIQVRAITRLAIFSNSLGFKGFKSEGASEIRMAGNAVIKMKRKIKNELNNKIQFLARISHDLGTLVTRIILQLEIAKKPSHVKKIKKDIFSIKSLLDEYLIFAKQSYFEDNKDEVNLEKILKNCLHEIKMQHKKKKITLVCNKDLKVNINLNNISRVFSNLVGNACHYANKIEISVKNHKNNFVLQIDDDGPGVPKELRKYVFNPFFREDTGRNLNKTNSGLGLSIVKEIMKKIGGKVFFEDSDLGGARIITIWPK